jgi:hypothetical protein
MTKLKNTTPSQQRRYVKSASHKASGRVALKSRWTRSGARRADGSAVAGPSDALDIYRNVPAWLTHVVGANLTEANLAGADLADADLERAQLRGQPSIRAPSGPTF